MRPKGILLLITLLAAIFAPQFPLASDYDFGHAIIVSDTASSVELREWITQDSTYLGQYYVGTEAQCESDPNEEYVAVKIGTQVGYMPSANLYLGSDPVPPKQPQAVVNVGASETLGITYEPELGYPFETVSRGELVTVLGETQRHFCYIRSGSTYGYVPADKLLIGTTVLPDEPAVTQPTAAPQATGAPGRTNPPRQTQAPAVTNLSPAQGNYGTAFVTAQTSKRVNLRKQASARSNSLGLYYVGTQVQCLSDPYREWVNVSIGSRSGYMKSEYLYRGETPQVVRQPQAFVQKAVSLRQGPTGGSTAVEKLQSGQIVTVLGETDTGWSYVFTGSADGYVSSKSLTVLSAAVPSDPSPSQVPSAPSPVPSAPHAAQQANYTMNSYQPSPEISILYPQFADERLNALILDKLRRMTQSFAEGGSASYTCAVTLNNDKMVSIVFWGGGGVPGGMHESTGLHTLNIDVKNGRELTLQDMYAVRSGLEQVFLQKATYPSAPQTSYDAASFPEMLMLQTPAYQAVSAFDIGTVQCFLKPDGIVLSMPSVHATGCDHFEGQLNYSDIQDFYLLDEAFW